VGGYKDGKMDNSTLSWICDITTVAKPEHFVGDGTEPHVLSLLLLCGI